MKRVLNWLDSRIGYRRVTRELLEENLPGSPAWRHIWGKVILFSFIVQAITGLALWAFYSPSTLSAWESVFYIQHDVSGGWLLRGIHHFMADAMVIILALHLMQMIIMGAYRAPNEVVFWLAILLFILILATALTGYLLPWDQHGYWGTKVRIGYLGLTPVIGPTLQKLAVGGSELSNLTLTRFFMFHAGLLPGAIIVVLICSRGARLRAARQSGQPTAFTWWPEQAWRDSVACLAVIAFMLLLVFRSSIAGGDEVCGAGLAGPVDPGETYAAARPEWYFLFLHRFLKFLPGSSEVWGVVIIPGLILCVVAAMPFIGKWRLGYRFNLIFCCCIAGGVVGLTLLSVVEDQSDGKSRGIRDQAYVEARRATELASAPDGIPPSGALALVREDPLLQGPKLFSQYCASCHRYDRHDGLGNVPKDPQSASDLKGFASREWLTGLLDPTRVDSTNYFGATRFRNGKMVKFVKHDVAGFGDRQKENLRKGIMALSAGARLPMQAELDTRDEGLINEGRGLIADQLGCVDCHAFPEPDDLAEAPTLVNYGSREWLIRFIGNPSHPLLYGRRNDRMPDYLEEQILDEKSIRLIADWLREDWYRPDKVVAQH